MVTRKAEIIGEQESIDRKLTVRYCTDISSSLLTTYIGEAVPDRGITLKGERCTAEGR